MSLRTPFAVAAIVMLLVCISTTAHADDDLMSQLASGDVQMNDAATVDETDFGQSDVDSLLSDGEDIDDEQAVAACYRRFSSSYGYRSYGYRNYSYRSCYTPSYSYGHNYYTPRCYTPVTYSYYTPVYHSYWGCW